MNYITLILCVAIVFGMSDFVTERYPNMQRQVYWLAFGAMYVLCTIKYYYGPDMVNYYDYYVNDIDSLQNVFAHPTDYPYEAGFNIFCALCKAAGMSLYGVTVVVSTIYFVAIFLLFKQIPRKRSFALMLLMTMDYSLILITYRQCLSVAFFIIMLLCLQDKRYVLTMVFAVLSGAMHKSGIVVVSLVLLVYMCRSEAFPKWAYQFLMCVLAVMLLFPVARLLGGTFAFLPAGGSIAHHLSLGKQIQTVWLIYALTIVCAEYYLHYQHERMDSIAVAVFVGLVLVVTFYQYYYLLNRLRSHFLPLAIVWGFRLVQEAEDGHRHVPYGVLLKQTTCLVLLLFCINSTYRFDQGTKLLKSKVYDTCTLLDLRNHDSNELMWRQIHRAQHYWWYEFMKNENNKL